MQVHFSASGLEMIAIVSKKKRADKRGPAFCPHCPELLRNSGRGELLTDGKEITDRQDTLPPISKEGVQPPKDSSI